MSENVLTLTGQNWETEVTRSDGPVLVDFWAEWCAPCRLIAPMIEAVAAEYAGRIKVGKLNVDEEGEIAYRHGIRSIPTLMVFKAGSVVEHRIGVLPKEELHRILDAHAAAPAA